MRREFDWMLRSRAWLMGLFRASAWSFCSARLKGCIRICLRGLFLYETEADSLVYIYAKRWKMWNEVKRILRYGIHTRILS
jgi:hypothetical protein